MTYLILANVSLILFFGIYLLVLKPLTFFQWNRIYLLSTVAISFAIPLLQFLDLSQHKEVYQPLVVIDFVELKAVQTDAVTYNYAWSAMDWVRFVYVIGAGLMLFWLGIRLHRVFTSLRGNITEQKSFSFFNRLFIAEGASHRDVIASHEQIHIKQGHSYDILFLEAVRAFNWFNPIFYFYLKELKFQHECIADKACSGDRVQYAELLVANAMDVSHRVLVHEFSNQSFLKQRIMMLFKNKSKKISRVKYLLIVPTVLIVSGVALAFNHSIKEPIDNQVQRFESLEISLSSTQKNRVPPEPEKGREVFMKWFIENYKIPGIIDPADKDPFLSVRFNVSQTGKLSDFQLAEGTQFGKPFFDEAVRLISKSTWKPAEEDGKAVDSKGWVGFKFDASGKIIENHTRVDVSPEPKGGLNAWRKYIGKWYQFPQEFADQKASGEVIVSFVVGKNGEIRDLKTLKEPVTGAGKRVHDVILKFGAWKPGILDGQAVEYHYELPVKLSSPDGYGVIEPGYLTSSRIM